MSPIVESSDWKLGLFMEWRPKNHSEECTHCHGSGEVGGGFKDIEGARPCPTCFGTGTVSKPPKTPKPELPSALVEHMRRAWWDFLNKPQEPQPCSADKLTVELVKALEFIEGLYSYEARAGENASALYEACCRARAALAKHKEESP